VYDYFIYTYNFSKDYFAVTRKCFVAISTIFILWIFLSLTHVTPPLLSLLVLMQHGAFWDMQSRLVVCLVCLPIDLSVRPDDVT